MNINKRKAAYLTVAAVVVIALILLALPPLIKHIAISKIDEATGRKSSIRELTFNPFTLKAGVSGFKLSEKGSSAPFLSFSSARLSLSPLSLPKRSFIVTEIKIASPYLHLVRTAPNSYNFSDLVAPKKEQKKEGTPLFSLNNIVIENGSVDFEDKALKEERFHRIRGMNIAIPFISNIAYLADRYVTPHFGAVINDSAVRFDGRLKPLTRAIEATIALNLKHVDLPFYLGYVPFPLPVKLTSGRLTTGVELGYRIDEKKGPDARISGEVALEGVALREPKGAPVASLEHGKVNLGEISFLSRRGDVKSLELSGMELHVARDRAGKWNLMTLGRNGNERQVKPKDKQPTAGQKEEKPFDLKIESVALRGGKIHFSDSIPAGGFKTDLQEINLSARALSLAQGTKSPFELKFRTSKGETLDLQGNLSLKPLDLQANLALSGVSLKEYYPYLQETLAAPVQGKVGLSSEVIYNDSQGVVLRKSNLKAERLSARFVGDEGFALQQLLVTGLTLDLKRNTADVERVDLRKGHVTISGEKGGGLSARHLLKTKLEKTAAAARPSAPAKKQPALSYRIHKLTTSDIDVNFTDKTREEEPRFPLSGIALTATGITGPKQGPIPFTLSAGYGKKGRFKAGGRFTPEPVAFKGNVDLRGIPLRDFDAYLPEDLAVFIADGALDTAMAVDVAKGAELKGSFDGSLGVRSFYCQDTDEGEDLLKWERLQLDRVKGTLAPFTLAINDVALSNFYSRVIVEKDGTLNLQHLRTSEEPAGQHGEAGATQPAAKTSAPHPAAVKAPAAGSGTVQSAAAPPESSAQPHPITINAITMQGGTMEFSDRHLQAPFDTTFYNLGGRVSGLSSQATRFADVDLRGNLENHSPLSIKGAINPLRGDLYLDLNVAFNDIELSPLTPYSGTYLGYNVDKGKLFLNLSYKIDKKTLSSQNKVFIDQFTFGDAVDSPKATKLPVRLAVALLKDRKGEIHLDLPVAGRTDDPQFSVWKVVLQILKNLLVKAATSPMALLGSMVGGGEDFTAVAFAPGSGRIEKGEQEKLMKLSQALQERPALTLDLTGYVERERDAEGYRNEILMRKMKGEKFRKLVKSGKTVEGQTQQEVQILPEEYPLYLKEVYLKEKFPKPRNAVGFLKSLPDEEMKKLIVTHTEVGQNELQALARERAEAVKAFLMKEGKIPAERLYLKSADIYRPPAKEGGSASRVEFAANIR